MKSTTTRNFTINSIEFNTSSISKFLKNKRKFLELLSIAIYLTSGSPIRGEELALIKYRNTLETKFRNIVIKPRKEWIRINTTQYKAYNTTRVGATNTRFLGPKLSNIIKLYLLVVILFYRFLAIKELNYKQFTSYLLEDKNTRFTRDLISNLLAKETLAYLRESLSLNPYRQLINYIIKYKM